MRSRLRYVFCFLLATLAIAAKAEESSRADFEKICGLMEGRWIGDVTWVADWPGLGKKGEKVTAYSEWTRAEDGNVMNVRFFGGTGSASGMLAYDAAAKKIRGWYVVSGGYVGQEEFSVEGNTITIEGRGSLPDGRSDQYTSFRTFADDGASFVDTGSGAIDGKPNAEQRDTWRKISGKFAPGEAAEPLRELGEKLVGRWIRDIVWIYDWNGATSGRGGKATGYHEITWSHDKHMIREVIHAGETRGENLYVFDPPTRRILIFNTVSDGTVVAGEMRKESENEWSARPIGGGTSDGKAFGGEIKLTFSQDGNRLETSGQIFLGGQPLDALQDVYRRVDRERSTQVESE